MAILLNKHLCRIIFFFVNILRLIAYGFATTFKMNNIY